jgi:hypothetical protein
VTPERAWITPSKVGHIGAMRICGVRIGVSRATASAPRLGWTRWTK